MTKNRKRNRNGDPSEVENYPSSSGNTNKRQRTSTEDGAKQSHTQGRMDPTFGQRSAIPGLDDYTAVSDEDLDYGEDMDALSYLRSVR
jgi:hypothetical protein